MYHVVCFDNVARCVVYARALGPDTVYLLVTPKSCLLRAVSGSRSGSGCKARLLDYSSDMCVILSCCESPYCGRRCYRLLLSLTGQVQFELLVINVFNHANASLFLTSLYFKAIPSCSFIKLCETVFFL